MRPVDDLLTENEIQRALAKGGRWVRAFNKNCVLTPSGKLLGVPKGVDTSKYKPGSPEGRSAILKGPEKAPLAGKTTLKKMSDRKLRAHAQKLDKALTRADELARSMKRDLDKVRSAKQDAEAEKKRRGLSEARKQNVLDLEKGGYTRMPAGKRWRAVIQALWEMTFGPGKNRTAWIRDPEGLLEKDWQKIPKTLKDKERQTWHAWAYQEARKWPEDVRDGMERYWIWRGSETAKRVNVRVRLVQGRTAPGYQIQLDPDPRRLRLKLTHIWSRRARRGEVEYDPLES